MELKLDLLSFESGRDTSVQKEVVNKSVREKDDKKTNKYGQKTIGTFNQWIKQEAKDVLDEIHDEQAELVSSEEESEETAYLNSERNRARRALAFFQSSSEQDSDEENQNTNSMKDTF